MSLKLPEVIELLPFFIFNITTSLSVSIETPDSVYIIDVITVLIIGISTTLLYCTSDLKMKVSEPGVMIYI